MPSEIIKILFIFFNTTYTCLRLMNTPIKNIIYRVFLFVLPMLLSLISYIFNLNTEKHSYLIPLLLLWLSVSILTKRPQEAFVSVVISFGINYSVHALSGLLAIIIIYPNHPTDVSFPYLTLSILTSVVHAFITIELFHIKRFRNGMPFLFRTPFINIATAICVLFISFLMYSPATSRELPFQILVFFIFVTTLAFLIFWWQAQLTKSYKHSLELRELESLRSELEEKDKKLAELSAKNEQLGRLIHKDNKLIPALENAVCEYLVTDFENNEEAIAKGNSLLLEIREFSNNRANVITEISANKCTSYSTGITSLDTLLNYMAKRAQQDNIQFSVHFGTELDQHIPHALSVDDLVHLLSDLLENALIATTGSANPVVQLQFYQFKKHLVLEVSDNGIPFETASIVNFGLEQLTTHADAGGSGIGLMDIWNIKEKYRASLHIDEYETSSPYAKKISLTFNKKNHYSVRTWRKAEIDQASRRIDLLTFDYKK